MRQATPIGRVAAFLALALGGSGLVNAQSTESADTAGSDAEADDGRQIEEVVVTARRKEETLQEVPIAITVIDQEKMRNNNISNSADLSTYAPSLNTNTRFGPDQASFSIRGFTQELRTTASVGFYFADVVAPRGGGSLTSGDGAGPGLLFDLENVQVLKGPQGTLFGRNTTGGAILVVPKKPTDEVEGYLEVSAGDFDMQRLQGVFNTPINDRARVRFGVDVHQRDGHIRNTSGVGPDDLSNVDYIAGRGSLVLDLTDRVENYTVFSYTNSENNGTISGMFACNPDPNVGFSSFCMSQQAEYGTSFYDVQNPLPNPEATLEQWQAINTTRWDVSDSLTIKNILSYADMEQTMRTAVFGTDFRIPDQVPGIGGLPFVFTNADQYPGVPSNSQTSFVEELQFQGQTDFLTWQAGLYYESSEPDGISGSQSLNQLYCATSPGRDSASFQCQDVLRQLAIIASQGQFDPGPIGNVQLQLGEVEYENRAVYAQATYDLSEQFRATAGVRYTWDETTGLSRQIAYNDFPTNQPGAPGSTNCVNTSATQPDCTIRLKQESDAPTWLIDFDYLPNQNVMLYTKYARGYRQGSVNIFGPEGFQTHGPEEVDSYELGAKTRFGGPVPGTFNVALFYNDLEDQQIQSGFVSSAGMVAPTTGIVNAGSSTIQGLEIDTSLLLLRDLTLSLAYTYLDTELKEIEPVTAPPGAVYDTILPTATPGSDLAQSPRHSATTNLTYRLPVSGQLGDMSVAATHVYVDEQDTASTSPFGRLDAYNLLNLNMNWNAIASSPFDAALFVTNVTDEEYTVYVPGLINNVGAEFRVVGLPRMWGARLRYNF